jgi:predicted membrane protein
MRDWRVDNGVAHYRLHSEGIPFRSWWGWHSDNRTWSLDLSSSVPMSLRVDTGVGESQIDLSGLKVTDLNVSSGVGQTHVWLPAQGRVQAKVSGGVGQLIVTIPEGMAASLHASAGLGGLSVSSRFASRGGGEYVSSNYTTADDRVDLNISGGVGEVVVR